MKALPKGVGRWAYCKYCYKNVAPIQHPGSTCPQVACSICEYGLSPYFKTGAELVSWWKEPYT